MTRESRRWSQKVFLKVIEHNKDISACRTDESFSEKEGHVEAIKS